MENEKKKSRVKTYGTGLNTVVLSEGVFYEENDTYGKFEIGPLSRSYGTTVGNLLRRVLLTSTGGAAIVGVRFKGKPPPEGPAHVNGRGRHSGSKVQGYKARVRRNTRCR